MILNNYLFYVQRDEAVEYALYVANSEHIDVKEIARWVRQHSLSVVRVASMTDDELQDLLGILRPSVAIARQTLALLTKD